MQTQPPGSDHVWKNDCTTPYPSHVRLLSRLKEDGHRGPYNGNIDRREACLRAPPDGG